MLHLYPSLNNVPDFDVYFTEDFVSTNLNWPNYRVTLLTVLFIKAQTSLLFICYDRIFVLTWTKYCFIILIRFKKMVTSSNLVATHSDTGACLNENSLWLPHYATSVVGAHWKNLPHQTWIQYRSHGRDFGMEIKSFISILYPDQIIQTKTKFFIEFFLNRMRECILIYFVCDTVSAMDTCGAQQSTWHPGKHDGPSVHSLCVHLPCHLFNIYFMKQWCLTKIQNDDLCFSMSLAWCLIPNQFH